MVLLLYLWENLKKWSSKEEMRGAVVDGHGGYVGGGSYGVGAGGVGVQGHKQYGVGSGGVPVCSQDEQDYPQLGGIRRLDSANSMRAHFYPEGGWGWIVCACAFLAHVTTSGAQLSAGALHIILSNKFQDSNAHHWLGPLSWSVSSVCSPLVVNLCRRKNVRVLALVGGFLFPLSLLFTSFATELHQIFFSFGLIGGIGSCIVRESSGVVLGEYFRRRRHFVEQVVLAGTGVGVTLFSLLYLSLSRHIEWTQGFRIGAGLSTICALLPAFYRTAAQYHPNRSAIQQFKQTQRQLNKANAGGGSGGSGTMASSILLPLGGDIFHSLHLFCVPSLKPILWSASIASFGLYAPVFLMSDFGRKEGLSGGSLLLLQTHLGLGLSLGVILGAILTLKKFRCCSITPRMLCCATCVLTGISMIAISSVKGYYGYSLSAWIYGIALGSYLYTLKILTMDLTRTKYWSRIWSCIQSIMAPGILIGTGATSYLGKPGFYACATCVLIGAGLIGFQLIDLSKCGSPPLSSVEDNESPIPPVPPPVLHSKYGNVVSSLTGQCQLPATVNVTDSPGFFPLRKSMSLQQPFYPCCTTDDNTIMGTSYSPNCPDCNPLSYPPMIRSFSLPQELPQLKTTGTQTNPNSPERHPLGNRYQQQLQQQHLAMAQQLQHGIIFPGSFDRLPTTATTPTTNTSTATAQGPIPQSQLQFYQEPLVRHPYKHSVMFASNPQLYPQSSFSSQTDSSRPPSSAANFYSQPTQHRHHSRMHYHLHSGSIKSQSNQQNIPSQPQQQQQQQQPRSSRSGISTDQSQDFENGFRTDHFQQQQQQRQAHQHQHQRGRGGSSFKPEAHVSTLPMSSRSSSKEHPHQTSTPAQPGPILKSEDHQQQRPAFTRHYFDSSKILQHKKAHVQFKKPEREQQNSNSNSNSNPHPHQQKQPDNQGQTQHKTSISSAHQGHSQEMTNQSQSQNQGMTSSYPPHQSTVTVKQVKYPFQRQSSIGSYSQSNVEATSTLQQHPPNIPPSVYYFQAQSQVHSQHKTNNLSQPHSHNQSQGQGQSQGQNQGSKMSNIKQQERHESQSTSQRRFSQFAPTPQPVSNYPPFYAYHQPHQHQKQQQQQQTMPAQKYNIPPSQSSQQQQQQQQQQQMRNSYSHHQHPHQHQHQQQPQVTSASSGYHHQQQQQQHQSHHHRVQHQQQLLQQQQQQQPQIYPSYYYNAVAKQHKVSSSEFDIEEPKFNSLRRPTSSNSNSTQGGMAAYYPPSGMSHGAGGGGSGNTGVGAGTGSGSGSITHCPYCDLGPDRVGPPLSLSVPIIQPTNPHLMCHYGISANHPMLRRRNTWHYHKDYLEAITTSV